MYVNSKAQVCPLDIGQPSLRYERRRPVIQCPVEVKFCQVITSPPPQKKSVKYSMHYQIDFSLFVY